MTTYQWDSAVEWFEEYIDRLVSEGKTGEVVAITNQLAQKAGNDEIQDLYQSEMIADGFFKEDKDEFKTNLLACVQTLSSYQKDAQAHQLENPGKTYSPEQWLEDTWGETIDNVYDSHDTAKEAIAYLKEQNEDE